MKHVVMFPSYPSTPNQPDPMFSGEYTAAKAAGFGTCLVDVEIQFGGEPKFFRFPEAATIIYRGWILKPADYEALEFGVRSRGSLLLTSVEEYRTGNELPLWYPHVKETPRSIWTPPGDVDMASVVTQVAEAFGDHPVLLKDYVKSRKQDWHDACFIPSGADGENVRRVVGNFLEITGDTRLGGLVFRDFLPLKQIGIHPKSRMPLVNEYRGFFYKGTLFFLTRYWVDGAVYDGCDTPDPAWMHEVTKGVRSPFFTADVAQKDDGTWALIEIGDGGPSGLPNEQDADIFYECLRHLIPLEGLGT